MHLCSVSPLSKMAAEVASDVRKALKKDSSDDPCHRFPLPSRLGRSRDPFEVWSKFPLI